MSWNKRELRSTRITASSIPPGTATIHAPVVFGSFEPSSSTREPILILPPGSKLPGLDPSETTLLRRKQSQLIATTASRLSNLHSGSHILNALSATLIFAQYEAGTAVCVDPRGYLLTCSHCIADTKEEWTAPGDAHKQRWLLFYTGLAVRAMCIAWDPKRDLALLKVTMIEAPAPKGGEGGHPSFAFVTLAARFSLPKESIICIGQPGRDDLESSDKKRTKYDLFEISEGKLRGMVPDVDPEDCSEIGTLRHDAWTYWGHSGAPLLKSADGALVGLHSSWDDQTAMRHGIPCVAIEGFLRGRLSDAMALLIEAPRELGNVDEREDEGQSWRLDAKDTEARVPESGASGKRSNLELVDLTGSSP